MKAEHALCRAVEPVASSRKEPLRARRPAHELMGAMHMKRVGLEVARDANADSSARRVAPQRPS